MIARQLSGVNFLSWFFCLSIHSLCISPCNPDSGDSLTPHVHSPPPRLLPYILPTTFPLLHHHLFSYIRLHTISLHPSQLPRRHDCASLAAVDAAPQRPDAVGVCALSAAQVGGARRVGGGCAHEVRATRWREARQMRSVRGETDGLEEMRVNQSRALLEYLMVSSQPAAKPTH